jgi:hypothetical protein
VLLPSVTPDTKGSLISSIPDAVFLATSDQRFTVWPRPKGALGIPLTVVEEVVTYLNT